MGELTLGSNRRLCHVCRSPCRETRAGRTKTASFNDHSQPCSIHPKTHLNQAIRDLSWAYVSLHNVPGDTSFDCRSSSLSFSSLNCSSFFLNCFSFSINSLFSSLQYLISSRSPPVMAPFSSISTASILLVTLSTSCSTFFSAICYPKFGRGINPTRPPMRQVPYRYAHHVGQTRQLLFLTPISMDTLSSFPSPEEGPDKGLADVTTIFQHLMVLKGPPCTVEP